MGKEENLYANVKGVSHNQGQRSPDNVSERRTYKAAAVCLGLLCVLLLAGVIGVGLFHLTRVTVERDQHQSKYDNLTRERDQLQTKGNNLTRERDQLQTKSDNLTRERDKLQMKYDNLIKERDHLQNVYCCPNGWKKLNCSCYYVSTERKNWTDSRQDCRDRGADLVILNSPEEQVFLNNLKKRVWIGLTDTVTEGTFIWVDGTPLTTLKYWWGSQPDNYSKQPGSDGEDCAEIYYSPSDVPPPKTWNDYTCDSDNFWVCEKRI
ncbi:CD209 antigen-like protein E isoform X2 [Hypomesus transpacificus]|uniref:CD209 antigen-like protein E isoform X2 n=1 Tax=Hypomesus transpacificus TaxID=137520 RepID=UPI001F082EF4|nr:CD209 antigen-like protein E isoform X2 [Hypomesus transpacificus]